MTWVGGTDGTLFIDAPMITDDPHHIIVCHADRYSDPSHGHRRQTAQHITYIVVFQPLLSPSLGSGQTLVWVWSGAGQEHIEDVNGAHRRSFSPTYIE